MGSIRTAGLTKDFGDLRAVNEIDLDVPEGGVAGFVGPNGAGKSTTIRMLLGLITPTSGDGEVLGHPIDRPAPYLHRVGALIEAPAFYPTLTGEANLRVFARLGGHVRARIPELLDVVGLAERGGDRYRKILAREAARERDRPLSRPRIVASLGGCSPTPAEHITPPTAPSTSAQPTAW